MMTGDSDTVTRTRPTADAGQASRSLHGGGPTPAISLHDAELRFGDRVLWHDLNLAVEIGRAHV